MTSNVVRHLIHLSTKVIMNQAILIVFYNFMKPMDFGEAYLPQLGVIFNA